MNAPVLPAPHLSVLQLDEVVAGLQPPPDHLEGCALCQGRLQEARAAVENVRDLPGYGATLARLSAPRSREASWWGQLRWAWVGLALSAATGVIVVVTRPDPVDRLKGGPALTLKRGPERVAGEPLHPGERVRLSVATAGHPYLLVLAVDSEGHVAQLWPTGATASGKAPEGGTAILEPGFEVTPGDVLLHAVLSATPLPAHAVRAQLEQAWSPHLRAAAPLSALPAPAVEGESGHARLFVHVD